MSPTGANVKVQDRLLRLLTRRKIAVCQNPTAVLQSCSVVINRQPMCFQVEGLVAWQTRQWQSSQ
jgi:hypothetical protein